MLPFNDISYAQGLYFMDADPNKMIMMKASGGDGPLPGTTSPFYLDVQLVRNYANAIRLKKIPFMYHVLGNNAPLAESGYFLAAVSPFAKGDGYALDIEPSFTGTVQDVVDTITHFQSITKCYPWVYIDRSIRQAHNWSPVFNLCSEWIAAPDVSFDANIPGVGIYVAQQGPVVNGHDTNMYFGSDESLLSYTYAYTPPVVTPIVSTPPIVTEPPVVTPEPPVTAPLSPTVAPVVNPTIPKHIDIIPPVAPVTQPPATQAIASTVTTSENISLIDSLRYMLAGYKTYIVTIVAFLYGVIEQGYQQNHWTNFSGAWTWIISAAGLAALRAALNLHTQQIIDSIESIKY